MPDTPADRDRKARHYAQRAAEAPTINERANARRWLRRNGYPHLVPDVPPLTPAGRKSKKTTAEPAAPPLPPVRICRVHDHLDRRCACYTSTD
ncbi:hypothetical protein [Amycolatopsis nigrescens]|uniref:hypothetical protein n=1 Tax=Amycolatopsis nigrescens TaxID=381445 RepID=UPI0003A8D963|nr:hypothetical protein [Amycolatopsis nigrescens]